MIGHQFVSLAAVDVPTSCTHWVEGKNPSLSAEMGLEKKQRQGINLSPSKACCLEQVTSLLWATVPSSLSWRRWNFLQGLFWESNELMIVGVPYNVHISDHSSPCSPLPHRACQSSFVWTSSLIFNWSPLLLPLTPKSFINTDCENGPFTYKLVHVIPLLKTYLYHSEKPIIFQWHTRSSTSNLHPHIPCPITHRHTSQMLFSTTSHSLSSGTLASLLNLKCAYHFSASRSLLKCLHLSGEYILMGRGWQTGKHTYNIIHVNICVCVWFLASLGRRIS